MSVNLMQDRMWIIFIDDLFVAPAVDVLGVDILFIVLIDNAFRFRCRARRCSARASRR